ncbi:coiled-coil alpha-helical rod protein 1-like isoform X1 [Gigantopelta aegis]|uniref:coiled-coil alpha-helical rod protein 1-like isoform X1 n=2 Tax=Gigantopelta aegis TaxID=1735272 RepID=UPI001B88A609|nr:coiled-coil alpha-helical rod protein 1-like isoform X1 [Gigantopelta aegis]
MAAHLNKPTDFIPGSEKAVVRNPSGQINMELLPPSMFKSTKIKPDAWKELAKATNEILQLKDENQRLRNANRIAIPSDSEINANVKIIKQVSSDEGRYMYADELISRQATEIDKVKGELRRERCQYDEEIGELKKQLATQERDHDRYVASLQDSLRDRDRRYEEQVDRLSYEHQKEIEDLTAQLDNVTAQLTECKSVYSRRIRELEAEVESIRQDASVSIRQLETEIRSKMATLENQEKQIAQMKIYIGEAEKTYKPAEAWIKENETLQNKLKILEAEKENLESSIELLNVRLSSITKILNVQECEISKAKASHLDKNKQESLLISRWRDKVFALLVQLESAEIIRKKNDQNWTYKVSDLEEKLSTSENDLEVLSQSLSVKTAELQMEMNNNKKLQVEITQAQQIALALDDQLRENRGHLEQLVCYVQSIESKSQATFALLQTTLSTLKTYNQRISFAGSRIEMLQGQFSRRDALLRLQYTDKQKAEQDLPNADTQSTPSASHICEELEKVTKERDMLAAQMREDSLMWNGRLDDVRSQYENEIISLKKTIEDLEFTVQQKSQTCASLSERLEQCHAQMEELSERNEDLKTNLAKQQLSMQNALEEQKAADESRNAEAFAELDRKLNEAKREATKTVIHLRQLERQSTREKERAAEQLRTTEEHYKRQLQKLQEKLIATERDRNMLMATLRQEGLVSRLRSDREEPVQLELDDVPQQDENILREQPDTQEDEPLESVLEDLKVLTAAVMNEESPSEENEDY